MAKAGPGGIFEIIINPCMQIRNSISLPTGKDMRTVAGGAECHRPLLTTLALQLGIDRENAPAMVEAVMVKGSRSFLLQKERYTLKAWLAKILVRDCVFKLNHILSLRTTRNRS
jgi:hypothetical protein